MNTRRRNFIRATGLTGLGLAGGGLLHGGEPRAGDQDREDTARVGKQLEKAHVQRFNMSGYAAPPLERVRIAIIGLGQRGPAHMAIMSQIEGTEIRALCDIRPENADAAKRKLAGTAHNPDVLTGPEDWKRVCERDDIDLVMITTPWYMHAAMAVYAMEQGKHAASEVPAAGTIEECWQLVETAERTRKHCMMMENNSYLPFQAMTLNMARQGFFGEVVHADCAYNASKLQNNFSRNLYWDMWWLRQYASRRGNIYPTHGLGPVSQIMNINRGDRFDFLVSVESADFMMRAKAQELAAADEFFKPFATKTYRGNMNVTTIRTSRGRTIMLQHDATSPSPHSLYHGIYGTKGAALYDPPPPRLSVGNQAWVSPEEFQSLQEKYTPEIIRRMGELARRMKAGHGGTDLLEDWRLIDCLRNGLPLDQDVYDAAAWSAIVPLSEWSVLNRSNPIDVPDFTAGAWRTNRPNMDINLERGGNTKVGV
ncbi:MAG: Gfo/Idh/MocA family oxidoreductase [Acidobacteria bacterium]|nr:Gfo/Idh/MocA family oxidoreductase [Acidobacteriota bacterium]